MALGVGGRVPRDPKGSSTHSQRQSMEMAKRDFCHTLFASLDFRGGRVGPPHHSMILEEFSTTPNPPQLIISPRCHVSQALVRRPHWNMDHSLEPQMSNLPLTHDSGGDDGRYIPAEGDRHTRAQR